MATTRIENNLVEVSITDELLDYATYELIRECAEKVQNERGLRGLILHISSGGDNLGNMGSLPASMVHRAPKGKHGAAPLVQQSALNSIYACMKPTVACLAAKVEGAAIDLATFCDIRLARADCELCDTRVANGQTASTGISYLLPRQIGLSRAMQIVLLGQSFAADELFQMQFVHEVIPNELWQERLDSFRQEIANKPTRSYEIHKMQVLPQLDLNHDAAMVHSLGIRQTHVIKDRQEGIQAWRERRAPRFTGE